MKNNVEYYVVKRFEIELNQEIKCWKHGDKIIEESFTEIKLFL